MRKSGTAAENPIEAHGAPLEKQARALLDAYLKKNNLSLRDLTRKEKKEVVRHLYGKGLFNFKNAAPFIASTLKISRATLYNYIKTG